MTQISTDCTDLHNANARVLLKALSLPVFSPLAASVGRLSPAVIILTGIVLRACCNSSERDTVASYREMIANSGKCLDEDPPEE